MDLTGNYSVLTVSRHIVNYCNDKKFYIDNLKLQKLLYFIQAGFLYASEGCLSCFREDIVAWRYGPVVVEAYEEFKVYGSSMIPRITSIMNFNKVDWVFEKTLFTNPIPDHTDDATIINLTIDHFKDYSGTRLVNLTHEQSPWKAAYQKGFNTVIEKASIYDYFKN